MLQKEKLRPREGQQLSKGLLGVSGRARTPDCLVRALSGVTLVSASVPPSYVSPRWVKMLSLPSFPLAALLPGPLVASSVSQKLSPGLTKYLRETFFFLITVEESLVSVAFYETH